MKSIGPYNEKSPWCQEDGGNSGGPVNAESEITQDPLELNQLITLKPPDFNIASEAFPATQNNITKPCIVKRGKDRGRKEGGGRRADAALTSSKKQSNAWHSIRDSDQSTLLECDPTC